MVSPNPLELDLPPDLTAPRAARLALAALEPSDDAQLIVGELVTNAVLHGAPPIRLSAIRLSAIPLGIRLRVEVRGARAEMGAPTESSRGLMLIDRIARAWGISPDPPAGKRVWAEID